RCPCRRYSSSVRRERVVASAGALDEVLCEQGGEGSMPYPFAREHGNRTTQPMSNGRRVVVAPGLIAGVGAAAPASAQQAKQQGAQHPAATVEIRGQVPTPQFITVRPREIPA